MQANGTVLKSHWRHASGIKSCTAFTVVWNFMAWGSILRSDGGKLTVNGASFHSYWDAFQAHPVTAAAFLFPIIGLLMIYHCLALWVNRTEMKITNTDFIVNRGPLFWVGSKIRIPIKDIKQAYVQEYSPYAEYDKPVLRYRLMVQRFSVEETVVESEIRLYSDAQILETWIEKNLCIIDVPVPGEAVNEEKKAA